MKSYICAAFLCLAGVLPSYAGESADSIEIRHLDMERNGKTLSISMDLVPGTLKVKSNESVILQPVIVSGKDSLSLPSVGIYGKRRFIYHERMGEDIAGNGSSNIIFAAKDVPDTIPYRHTLDYSDWMDGAELSMIRTDRGCCSNVTMTDYGHIGRYREKFFPTLVYMQPMAQREKRRSLEGRSYIDFPVDRTEIYPEYRRNPIELDSIRRTIDIVRNDKDARIDTIWLKGYASPESPYSHNRDLAIGRTESLKKYINQLYRFENVAFLTDYEPEDWEGLRRFVEGSNIDHRREILALIDSDMDPDAKEARIKKLYPSEYRFMLQEYYPALRHTDYKVSYVVTSFSDPATILQVMKTRPGNLSQEEFYIAAETLEPGSDEFTEVFETAVRMYPDDETALVNAANAAIRRDDFPTASRYLEKAGTSAEADYARGACAVRRGDLEEGRRWLESAKAKGLPQADATLGELDRRNSTR